MKSQNITDLVISAPVTSDLVSESLVRKFHSVRKHLTAVVAMLGGRRILLAAVCLSLVAGAGASGFAQNVVPFGVSNPKNKKWPVDEATRIYLSACDQVARTIRPLSPPHLHPNFVLVLGAQNNEAVRDGVVSEVHLKNWDPTAFAQAVVILAAREILSRDDLAHITHEALMVAQASASVNDLRQGR